VVFGARIRKDFRNSARAVRVVKRCTCTFCGIAQAPDSPAEAPAYFVVRAERVRFIGSEHYARVPHKKAAPIFDRPAREAINFTRYLISVKFPVGCFAIERPAEIGHNVGISV
jgi:hypothetical protein